MGGKRRILNPISHFLRNVTGFFQTKKTPNKKLEKREGGLFRIQISIWNLKTEKFRLHTLLSESSVELANGI